MDDDANWRRKNRPLAEPYDQPVRTGFYGSRILGNLTEVTIGCMVWAHHDGNPHQVRLDHNGEPRGGIVLDTYPAIDHDWLQETGEPVERKHYRCINPYTPAARFHTAITTLTETQIVADGCEAPSAPLITRTLRNIDLHLSQQRGPLTPDQARLQVDAGRLAAALFGAAA